MFTSNPLYMMYLNNSIFFNHVLSHSCWITDDSYFYSLNLVYFTLIFVFNSGILVAVASSICKMKRVPGRPKPGAGAKGEKTWRDPQRFNESCKGGVTVLGLTCLMGTTWGLAFLGSGYVNYPILYLFCILNSLQGQLLMYFRFLFLSFFVKEGLFIPRSLNMDIKQQC